MSTEDFDSNQFKFENVWSIKNQELLDEIVQAWARVGAVPEGQSGLDRAKQVVYLIRDPLDKIAGISTAYIGTVPRLKNDFFIFRCMIFPEYRYPGLLFKITKMTIDYLESIHSSLNQKVVGVFTEVENEQLKKLNFAVLPSGLTFIGYSKRGNPIRVYYFKGAKI